MDIQPITVSGPLVPEAVTHAVEVSGFNFDWLLSAGLGIAILMFVIKEVWEWFKKWQDNNRKMQVYKRVIAQECYYLRTYSGHVKRISENVRHASGAYEVVSEPSGRQRLILKNEFGHSLRSIALPRITTSKMDRLIIETGHIDAKFSKQVSDFVGIIYDMANVRDQIIDKASPSLAALKQLEMEHLWVSTNVKTKLWIDQLNKLIVLCGHNTKDD